jgi:SPP1 family predicted phage head-tail adaptor
MSATPGLLNRRLLLEAPHETADGAGGVIRGSTPVTTLWARVLPLAARGDVAAGSRGAALRYAIVIRVRDDVTMRHRFRDGARLYDIVAVRESADRRFLEIDAEQRQD